MALYKGRGGALYVAEADTAPQNPTTTALTQQILQITEWSISGGPGVAEVTEFGDIWVERVTTISDWSGSARGFIDPDTIGVGHDELLKATMSTMAGTLTGSGDLEGVIYGVFLYSSSDGDGFAGNMIPSFEISGNVGGIFEVSSSFQGAGALEHGISFA